jgi:RND family efflux transporter MFP subunit
MNDPEIHDRSSVINTNRWDKRADEHQKHRRRRRWGGRLFALGGFVLLAGGLLLGAWVSLSQQREVMAIAEGARDFVPSVRVAMIEAGPGSVPVTLPGTAAAFAAANIYAHVSGYISERAVDIGDRVKKGELLALIDPRPYQAAQDQAKGQLVHDEAVLKEAQVDLVRYQNLVKTKAVPEQQEEDQRYVVEQDEGTVKLDKANVETAQLNLEYTRIIAPFDGVVSQRNIDVGDLVQADATSGTYMFTTMRSDVMRIYLYVPQSEAVGTAPGVGAVFRVSEIPDRTFPGKVTRTADALQPGTRTLLVEVDIPNPDGALSRDMYGAVELQIPRNTPSLSVPADAIIFNRNGIQVAVVTNGKAEIRKVTVTRDLGTRVE